MMVPCSAPSVTSSGWQRESLTLAAQALRGWGAAAGPGLGNHGGTGRSRDRVRHRSDSQRLCSLAISRRCGGTGLSCFSRRPCRGMLVGTYVKGDSSAGAANPALEEAAADRSDRRSGTTRCGRRTADVVSRWDARSATSLRFSRWGIREPLHGSRLFSACACPSLRSSLDGNCARCAAARSGGMPGIATSGTGGGMRSPADGPPRGVAGSVRSESQVMDVLWERGPATVRDVIDGLPTDPCVHHDRDRAGEP